MNRVLRKSQIFFSTSVDFRLLLAGNCIYAAVLPIIEIFIAAFVLRATNQARIVLLYQLSVYIATPVAFLLNGGLLRKIPSKFLYAVGMFASGVAIAVLTRITEITPTGIAFCGACMGLATGLFWANGALLAVSTTDDRNRNYFYGIQSAASTSAFVIVPWIVGMLIDRSRRLKPPSSAVGGGYATVSTLAILLTAIAAVAILSGRFKVPPLSNFLAFRFHPLWYRLLIIAALRGLTQGFIVTAPALFILRMGGSEGTLGRIEAVGGCVTAICAYWIGKRSAPKHRVRIFAAGVFALWLGSLVGSTFYNILGTSVFIACLIFAKPLIEIAYGAMELRVVDVVSAAEKRHSYTYLMNHEFAVFVGRLVGCGLFLVLGALVSETAALRCALPIVASLQLSAILVAKTLPL